MANFPVTLSTTGVFHAEGISETSAKKTSSLLQTNYDSFHVFWNLKGYHNHQVHYLLTAYALGADQGELQNAFDKNASYQRPSLPPTEGLVRKLYDERYFKSLLGYDTYFPDYTAFFLQKFRHEGWQSVVNQYLFSRSEIAEDLLVRLHAGNISIECNSLCVSNIMNTGVIHPLIHFGFGIEFQQPTVIAEALAQAACHNNFLGAFLLKSEELANQQTQEEGNSLIDLMQKIREDPALHDVEYWDGGDSLNDKIVSDAPKKLCEIAAKWKVHPKDLEERTAEMINVNAFVTGAAQRSSKEVKLDFFFIHCVNASIFFSAINAQPWLSTENKARLLEWKGRTDILTYASRLAPQLYPGEIVTYKPRQSDMTWSSLIKRTNKLTHDDGHISKLIRALAHGAKVCAPYEARQNLSSRFPLNGPGWLQIANMALDTTTNPRLPDRWVRGAGGAHNWDKFKDRE